MTALTKAGRPRQRVSPGAPISDRIALHTDRSGSCWLWTATTDRNGYGRIQFEGKLRYAHRLAYEALVGPIPDGKEVDHLCRVRRCCKPTHLEAVTPQTNVRRGTSPGAIALRRDVCLFGEHLYEEFGYVWRGRRACRQCRVDYARLWRSMSYGERGRRKMAGLPVVDLGAYYADRRQQVAA